MAAKIWGLFWCWREGGWRGLVVALARCTGLHRGPGMVPSAKARGCPGMMPVMMLRREGRRGRWWGRWRRGSPGEVDGCRCWGALQRGATGCNGLRE